jgi:D-alanyl-lipoteichoic acid acyltransferase DltB (MBOAT superfamily)
MFVMGLAKKVLLADSFAPFADAVFGLHDLGLRVGAVDAWIGTYAYTFQLYFDFSGYSDMAIGLGLMMGLRLPVNFFSPYKATSVIEFWRRWHITLSRFFRDYVYFPLGGNRGGSARRILNLLIVMAIVGLWHGAGWTFVLWGLYHGVLLAVTHILRFYAHAADGWTAAAIPSLGRLAARSPVRRTGRALAWVTTFHLVVLGWVVFRSTTMPAAQNVMAGLALRNGPWSSVALLDPRLYVIATVSIAAALVVCAACPNSVQIIQRLHRVADSDELRQDVPRPGRAFQWRLSPVHAVLLGLLAYLSLATISHISTEFLYFNF